MAGIRIEKARAGNPTGKVDIGGYVEFIEKVCGGNQPLFDKIGDFTNEQLVTLLKDLETGNPPTRRITFDEGKLLDKKGVDLTVVFDDRKKTARGSRKLNINLPAANPLANGGTLDYLNQYIAILGSTEIPIATKRKFLFGMLVLTKCR